jgi:dTDP-4-dehydrorhamnose reductase
VSPLPRVLVVGSTGQVGTEVCAPLEGAGFPFSGIAREQCDLLTRGATGNFIREFEPQVIVNAAAYTAVDKAESEPEMAEAINGAAPMEMAEEAKRSDALFIHYSTDYIFNGDHERPWTEYDAPGPLGVYGRTKLNGELGVKNSGAAAFTFRTSWVYGTHGANFLLAMLKLGREREELSVIDDQIGAPTWSRNLADVTMATIGRFTNADGSINLSAAMVDRGVYHATAGGETSWHGFATAIFDEARKRGIELKVKTIRKIKTADWPSAATRPLYSVMSNDKLNRRLGFKFPEWREALRQAMQELSQ